MVLGGGIQGGDRSSIRSHAGEIESRVPEIAVVVPYRNVSD